MASKDEQYLRIKKIDERLRRFQNTVVSTKELMKICDTPLRTFRKDMARLKDKYDAPIVYDKKRKGYYYAKDFALAIQELALNQTELKTLEIAGATLNQFKGLKVFADVQGVFDKIGKAISYKLNKSKQEQNYVHFEKVPYFRGSELITPFYEAIQRQRSIQFDYQKYENAEISTRIIDPYWLKEHKNRWYVIAWEHKSGLFKAFGLDRITLNNKPQEVGGFIRQKISLDDLMKYAFGMYVHNNQEKVEEVVLSMTAKRFQYFQSQPFFDYKPRNVRQSQDGFEVRAKLVINEEFVMELAKLGADIKVIAPESLKTKLIAHLRKAIEQY